MSLWNPRDAEFLTSNQKLRDPQAESWAWKLPPVGQIPNQTKVRFKIASGVQSSIWNSTFWTCGIHAMKWQRAPVLNNLFLQTLLHKVSLWYGLYHVLHTWRRSGYAWRMEKQGHNHHINPWLNPNTLMSGRTKSHHQQNTVTLIQLYIFCANSQHSSPQNISPYRGPQFCLTCYDAKAPDFRIAPHEERLSDASPVPLGTVAWLLWLSATIWALCTWAFLGKAEPPTGYHPISKLWLRAVWQVLQTLWSL